jgi:quercetin dioxygenase-like cupin family protein
VRTTDLNQLAEQMLVQARHDDAGRHTRNVDAGEPGVLTHTLVTLRGGVELSEHETPGVATLQVLIGRIRFITADEDAEVTVGQVLALPLARHRVEALEDSAFLLTVAGGRGRPVQGATP